MPNRSVQDYFADIKNVWEKDKTTKPNDSPIYLRPSAPLLQPNLKRNSEFQ